MDEEPGRLQSMGLQKVGHNWVTFTTILGNKWENTKKKTMMIGDFNKSFRC